MKRTYVLIAGGLLAILVVAVYWPALGGGFIWDDDAHVTKPELRSAEGLGRIWFEPAATQQYYPLVHSGFWLQWWVWHDDPVGYHVVNLLLHLLSALLVWAVLRRLDVPGAGLAAAVFALHPVHVESVAWITELKNTLSAVFYLAALLSYLRFDPPAEEPGDEPRRPAHWALAFALFVCALLSKTVTATLPAAILLILWWKRGRIAWRRDVVPLAPFFLVGAAFGLMTAWFERTYIGATGADFQFSAIERLLIAGRVFWFYLGKLLWPANLIFIYPRWNVDAAVAWQYAFPVTAVAVVVALWVLRDRIGRGPLTAVLFFGGTLFPVLGFFNVYPFKFSFVADHFQYLASLGVITLGAAGVATLLRRAGLADRPAGMVTCAALVLGLAFLSWGQTRIYRDAETLWVDTTRRNPTGFMAFNNLGYEYSRQNRLEEAVAAYAIAVENKPDFDQAWFNLGRANAKLGRTDRAIEAYQRAIDLRPDYAEAHYNLGLEYAGTGRTEDALSEFRAAAAAAPDFTEAHYNLGSALATLGRFEEAGVAYSRAIELRPDYAEAWLNVGVVANRAGNPDRAFEAFTRAIEIRPDYLDAHHNLGSLHAAAGRKDEAADTFTNLAQMLGQRGRYADAIEACRQAVTARPTDARAHYLMGAAHARLGDASAAGIAWTRASELDPAGENGRMAREGLELLSGAGRSEP
jgi:tetratricopeptide (TPR) repeat protein